jgi:hypothetical protein
MSELHSTNVHTCVRNRLTIQCREGINQTQVHTLITSNYNNWYLLFQQLEQNHHLFLLTIF